MLRAERGYTCGDVLVPPLPQQSESAAGVITEVLDLTREANISGGAAVAEEEEGAGARENGDAANGDGRVETPAADAEIEDSDDEEEEEEEVEENAAALQTNDDPYNKLRPGWKDCSTAVGGRTGKKTGNGVYTRLDSTSRTHQIMRCSDPVERLFYNSAVTVILEEKKKTVCGFCGGEDGVVDGTLEEKFSVVLPICPACTTSGLTALCYIPRRVNVVARQEEQTARKLQAVERGGGRGRSGGSRGGRGGGSGALSLDI